MYTRIMNSLLFSMFVFLHPVEDNSDMNADSFSADDLSSDTETNDSGRHYLFNLMKW